MRIDIWSDIVCPWCYIGKRHLEIALTDYPDDVEIHWHSFELDPSAPAQVDVPIEQILARKYGMTLAQARQAQERVTQAAAAVDLEFHLDRARTGNTFDAHRLLHLADASGHGPVLKERLLRAYFTEGLPISDHDALARFAVEVGLDEVEAREVLASGAYADAVREDEQQARQMGVRGVPFFVFDGRFGASGAQPPKSLRHILDRIRAENAAAPPQVDAPVCDDDGCVVPERA